MSGKRMATIGAAAVLGLAGASVATAAGSGNRADCPYATSSSPLRIHAQDGTGANARPGAPLNALDGTGPHGPWAAGR